MQETDRIRFAAPSDRPEAGISPEVTGPARRDAPVPREIREASELLKVVGDLTRMRILYALLTDGELSVSGLQKALGMSQSAVSHQLRVLRDTNLVTHRREWKMAYYSLADQHVNDFLRVVLEHIRHD